MRTVSATLLVALLAFFGCGRNLPSGFVDVTHATAIPSCEIKPDTTGHQKYEVTVEYVSPDSNAISDTAAVADPLYNITFWTRDETGKLHRQGAYADAYKDREHYSRAHYQWHSDSTVTVTLDGSKDAEAWSMRLYGWKGLSGGY